LKEEGRRLEGAEKKTRERLGERLKDLEFQISREVQQSASKDSQKHDIEMDEL